MIANNSRRPILVVSLLGGFRLQLDNSALHSIDSPRLQTVFAYLILHRQAPQSRRHVAFVFWPDSTERQAMANLRKLLHQLRQALPGADRFFAADANTIRWRPGGPYTLDVADFQALMATANTEETSENWQATCEALEKAVSL